MVASAGTAFVYLHCMRCLALVLAGMLLTGCAGRAKAPARVEAREVERENYWYEARTASALAFDPPVVASAVTRDLSREGRGPSAYVGYDEVVTTRFYLRQDDRQVIYGDDAGRFERRAVSERFGVSYR